MQEITALLSDKTIKPNEKRETLSSWISEKKVDALEVINFAKTQKDAIKGTCIEAFEFVTQKDKSFASPELFTFVVESLQDKAPRTKWESAKVVGNIAEKFPNDLEIAIAHLLQNTEHEGTVVRWAAAFALGEIVKLKTKQQADLMELIQGICEREEKNSIRKIYEKALKKIK